MSWHDDEGLYQPRIHSRRVRELYEVAQITAKPLTILLDQAIEEFVARHQTSISSPTPPQKTVSDRAQTTRNAVLNER